MNDKYKFYEINGDFIIRSLFDEKDFAKKIRKKEVDIIRDFGVINWGLVFSIMKKSRKKNDKGNL